MCYAFVLTRRSRCDSLGLSRCSRVLRAREKRGPPRETLSFFTSWSAPTDAENDEEARRVDDAVKIVAQTHLRKRR